MLTSSRTIVTALTLLIAVLTSVAQPRLEWLSRQCDFGAFDESLGTVTCQFLAVNRGDEPALVVSARANCGCTTPTYSPEPVLPGDTLKIIVGYNADGRPGRFNKNVLVTTNADEPRVTLTIIGTVIGNGSSLNARYPIDRGDVRLSADYLMFNDVRKTAMAFAKVEGYNASHDTIYPQFKGLPPYIRVEVAPKEVPPGTNFVISAAFDAALCPLYDLVEEQLPMAVADSVITLNATALVREDFTGRKNMTAPRVTVDPERLDAGKVDRSRPLKTAFTITNRGEAPLIIRRLYSVNPNLNIKLKSAKIEPGKKTKVEVSLPQSDIASREIVDDRIILVTNDPESPRRIIRLTGY